jgi:hypothetical protein
MIPSPVLHCSHNNLSHQGISIDPASLRQHGAPSSSSQFIPSEHDAASIWGWLLLPNVYRCRCAQCFVVAFNALRQLAPRHEQVRLLCRHITRAGFASPSYRGMFFCAFELMRCSVLGRRVRDCLSAVGPHVAYALDPDVELMLQVPHSRIFHMSHLFALTLLRLSRTSLSRML